MRRGQAWYADFMVGFLVFLIGLAAYYMFQSSFTEEADYVLEDMMADAKQIANSLMSPGFPVNWNPATVELIGLTDGTTRMQESKVDDFGNLDYNLTRSLFSTSYEYVVYFSEGTTPVTLPNNQSFIGNPPLNHTRLVTIMRLGIYNSSITSMEVQVWQ